MYINLINNIIIIFKKKNKLVTSVYFSESINEYAAENWESFSEKQYFDKNGLFISTVLSIPVLLNCMLMIVSIRFFIISYLIQIVFHNFGLSSVLH